MSKFKSYTFPLIVIGILFFVFGFLTWINGVLIPYFQICLELSNLESLWVAFAAYLAYFFMAMPSAFLLKRIGYKKGIVLGLVIVSLGTLLFVPAAYIRTYSVFLVGLFVSGSGLALLQTAVHPYLAIIGNADSTAQRIGFMGFSNKIAGILSQRILGAIFLFNADSILASSQGADADTRDKILDQYILRVVEPYILITVLLLILATLIWFSAFPDVTEKETPGSPAVITGKNDRYGIFRFPHLVLGVVALLMAGACEVIPIDGVIIYGRALGLSLEEARHFPEYTLYLMLAGYLSTIILIPKILSQQSALRFAATVGIILSIAAYFTEGKVSAYCLIAMGFGVAFLWGTIWGLAIRNLGHYTKTGSALLLMSVVGGGIFPLVFGGIMDLRPGNPQSAVLMLVPCYLYLLYYSIWGFDMKRWRSINPDNKVDLNVVN